MDLSLLEEVGLTKTEAKIYSTLLDSGSALAGAIAQKAGIHRRSVYDALERLIEKGLVSFITRNNRKWFEAASPNHLLHILDEKRDNIKDIIPEMEAKLKMAKELQETTFFKGKQALKTVFDDQIDTGKDIWVIGASVSAYGTVKYYFPHYDKRRVEKKIRARIIFDESARKEKYLGKVPLSEIRFLPKKYNNPIAINIYGDKVAIVMWTDEPAAILIRNREVADGYRKYFDLMWSIAKR